MAVRILHILDHARTQYYHFQAIIIAGMGIFTDAYDLFCIPPVMKLIGRLYYDPKDNEPGKVPPLVLSVVVATALVGTVVGQLVFGVLGDRVGRQRVYGLTLLLMFLSSIQCGFSLCKERGCVLASLCFFRFLLCVGIGGDHPLSASIMSEFANKRTRGAFIAAVFSMQGFGILASSVVTMVIAKLFQHSTDPSTISHLHTPYGADLAWRLIVMIGAVPAAMTFYWRMGMPETARYTVLVERDLPKATSNMMQLFGRAELELINEDSELGPPNCGLPPPSSYGLFSKQFLSKHGRDLFASATAWFIFDIPFCIITLFQSKIYNEWMEKQLRKANAYHEAFTIAMYQAIMAGASMIPGYIAIIFFIDRVGRRKIQMMGFAFMAIFLFAIAIPYDKYLEEKNHYACFILLGLTFFFSNFGPNTTTFIVPAELFPARFRSTCHGISGAAGKIGAMIGTIGFIWASENTEDNDVDHPGLGINYALMIVGGVCIIGMLFTYKFTPETMGISLEENEGEEGQERKSDETANGGEEEGNGGELGRTTSDTSLLDATHLRPRGE